MSDRHDTVDREAMIAEIQALLVGRPVAAGENLAERSDAYLQARLRSLQESRRADSETRERALTRTDAADLRQAIRLDSAAHFDRCLADARLRVHNSHSGLGESEQLDLARRIAHRESVIRARDEFIAGSTARRLDSLTDAETTPTASDLARARHEIAWRRPDEPMIQAHARRIARDRIAAEHMRALAERLPPVPPQPRIPQGGRR